MGIPILDDGGVRPRLPLVFRFGAAGPPTGDVLYVGDTLTVFAITCLDADGVAIDLSGADLYLVFQLDFEVKERELALLWVHSQTKRQNRGDAERNGNAEGKSRSLVFARDDMCGDCG